MKLIKTASGKTKLRLTKSEWEGIGKKAGWVDQGEFDPEEAWEWALEVLQETTGHITDRAPSNQEIRDFLLKTENENEKRLDEGQVKSNISKIIQQYKMKEQGFKVKEQGGSNFGDYDDNLDPLDKAQRRSGW